MRAPSSIARPQKTYERDTNMATIQDLEARQKELARRISAMRTAQNAEKRKAETHAKATLGGAVISMLKDPAVSVDDKSTLRVALALAREKVKTDEARGLLDDLNE